MAKLKDYFKAGKNSNPIDWTKVEESLGFVIHDDLKDFFSRMGKKDISDIVDFRESEFIVKTGDKRNDTWFSFNECEGKTEYRLDTAVSAKTPVETIRYCFEEWTGRNDFGRRAMIGEFYANIGQILILFNNDTGKIEWIDCGYGYFDVYEENPHGVLANSLEEFLEKLNSAQTH